MSYVAKCIRAALETYDDNTLVINDAEVAAAEDEYQDVQGELVSADVAMEEFLDNLSTLSRVASKYKELKGSMEAGSITREMLECTGRQLGISTESLGSVDEAPSMEGIGEFMSAVWGKVVQVFESLVGLFKKGWRNITYRWTVMAKEMETLHHQIARMPDFKGGVGIELSKDESELLYTFDGKLDVASEIEKLVRVHRLNAEELVDKLIEYLVTFVDTSKDEAWKLSARILESIEPPEPVDVQGDVPGKRGVKYGTVLVGNRAMLYRAKPGEGRNPPEYGVEFSKLVSTGSPVRQRELPSFSKTDIETITDGFLQIVRDNDACDATYERLLNLESRVRMILTAAKEQGTAREEVRTTGNYRSYSYTPGDPNAADFYRYFSDIYRDTTSALADLYHYYVKVGKVFIDVSERSMQVNNEAN